MEIESPARQSTQFSYRLTFQHRQDPNRIYRFRCDREGRVADSGLAEASLRRLERCRQGRDYSAPWIEEHLLKISVPAQGRCECGESVRLALAANTCQCGRRYDAQGQPVRTAHPIGSRI